MMAWQEVILRLALATFFGAIIGLERERKDWAAGLRTHMMVCLGASLAMIVSMHGFTDVIGHTGFALDPSRIAAQVISGIGFIGAGTILFLRQGIIRGLTTASGLWTVAAIGLATGGGMYFAAAAATVLAIIILWILQPFEKRLSNRFKQKSVQLITSVKEKSVAIINKLLEAPNIEIATFAVDKNDLDFIVSFKLRSYQESALIALINEFQLDKEIKEVTWNN